MFLYNLFCFYSKCVKVPHLTGEICFPYEETKISFVILLNLEIFNQLAIFPKMEFNYICILRECLYLQVSGYSLTKGNWKLKSRFLKVLMKRLYM